MNEDIKTQWIDALLSGDYEQGAGVLRNANGEFCCLGVLCDLAEKAGIVKSHIEDDNFYYDDEIETLPQTVQKWAGIDSRNPQVEYFPFDDEDDDSVQESIAEANDGGLSFEEIAKIIKEQL